MKQEGRTNLRKTQYCFSDLIKENPRKKKLWDLKIKIEGQKGISECFWNKSKSLRVDNEKSTVYGTLPYFVVYNLSKETPRGVRFYDCVQE